MSGITAISPTTTISRLNLQDAVAFEPSAAYITNTAVQAAATSGNWAAVIQSIKGGATFAAGAFAGVSIGSVALLTAGLTVALNVGSRTHDDAPILAALRVAEAVVADNPGTYSLATQGNGHVLNHNGTPIATINAQGFGPPPVQSATPLNPLPPLPSLTPNPILQPLADLGFTVAPSNHRVGGYTDHFAGTFNLQELASATERIANLVSPGTTAFPIFQNGTMVLVQGPAHAVDAAVAQAIRSGLTDVEKITRFNEHIRDVAATWGRGVPRTATPEQTPDLGNRPVPPGSPTPVPGSPLDLDRKARERVNEILEEIARTNGNDFMGGNYDDRVRQRARELQQTEPRIAFMLEHHLSSRLQIVDPHFTRPAYIEPTASSVTRHQIQTGDETDVAQSALSLTEDQVRNLHPLYMEDLRAKLEPVAATNPWANAALNHLQNPSAGQAGGNFGTPDPVRYAIDTFLKIKDILLDGASGEMPGNGGTTPFSSADWAVTGTDLVEVENIRIPQGSITEAEAQQILRGILPAVSPEMRGAWESRIENGLVAEILGSRESYDVRGVLEELSGASTLAEKLLARAFALKLYDGMAAGHGGTVASDGPLVARNLHINEAEITSNLQRIGAVSDGAMSVLLYKGEQVIRLHLYEPPPNDDKESVHTHGFPLNSVVLTGGLRNETFSFSLTDGPAENSIFKVVYGEGFSRIVNTGTNIQINPISSTNYCIDSFRGFRLTTDFCHDGVGRLCPDERLWRIVVLGDVAPDGSLKIDYGGEFAASQTPSGQGGEEAFDGVHP